RQRLLSIKDVRNIIEWQDIVQKILIVSLTINIIIEVKDRLIRIVTQVKVQITSRNCIKICTLIIRKEYPLRQHKPIPTLSELQIKSTPICIALKIKNITIFNPHITGTQIIIINDAI